MCPALQLEQLKLNFAMAADHLLQIATDSNHQMEDKVEANKKPLNKLKIKYVKKYIANSRGLLRRIIKLGFLLRFLRFSERPQGFKLLHDRLFAITTLFSNRKINANRISNFNHLRPKFFVTSE